MNGASVVFDPLLAWPVIAGLAALALAVTALSLWRGLKGWPFRALGFAVLLTALANPSLQTEERAPLADIALVLHDQSGSNRLDGRTEQTSETVTRLEADLARLGVETQVVTVPDAPQNGGTLVNAALDDALGDVPRDRLSGVFIVSDGISHDAANAELPAPVHLVQTGQAEDWDRRLIVRNAPAYAILGESIDLTLRIADEGAVPEAIRGTPARVGFSLNGGEMRFAQAPVGQDLTLQVTLEHGGTNVLHFTLADHQGELTDRNNQAVVEINGVRDRLRVLLVSGEPHTGQRTWRNLLKSDPAVDLVHFTILRPPNRQDGVPANELSLIAFPTRELFVDMIDEFDLIIFDRYRLRGILPNSYFDNMRRYVTEGGALLVVGGPELAGADSIARTPLGQVMPAQPTARMFTQAYAPEISATGTRHPVTADLAAQWAAETGAGWGRWLRQVELTASRGETVMTGADDSPLLILDRAGAGRVAVLASDQAWLWDRGFEGGGPQAELLRRLAHWMMGEPDLEEEALLARGDGDVLHITRRSLLDGPHEVTITGPDGETSSHGLNLSSPGRFTLAWQGGEPGLYRLRSEDLETVAVLGSANPREFEQVVADPGPLAALISGNGGGTAVLHTGFPSLRMVDPGRAASGRGWLGVARRGAYVTTDLRLSPLMPAWAWLLLGGLLILGGWLREARR